MLILNNSDLISTTPTVTISYLISTSSKLRSWRSNGNALFGNSIIKPIVDFRTPILRWVLWKSLLASCTACSYVKVIFIFLFFLSRFLSFCTCKWGTQKWKVWILRTKTTPLLVLERFSQRSSETLNQTSISQSFFAYAKRKENKDLWVY